MERLQLNLIVWNDAAENNKDLIPLFFGNEDFLWIPEQSMPDMLVGLGLFSSKSEVKKNWTRTGMEIPDGFTALENFGKLNHCLWIWKPI